MLSRSLVNCLLIYAATYAQIFLLSLFLQYIKGWSAIETGKLLIIPATLTSLFSPLFGKLSDVYPAHKVTTIGCCIVAIGLVALLLSLNYDNFKGLVAAIIIYGLVFAIFITPNNKAAMSTISEERLGIASSLLNLTRTFGNL